MIRWIRGAVNGRGGDRLEIKRLIQHAMAERDVARFESAISSLERASTLARRLGDKQGEFVTLTEIVMCFRDLGDHRRSVLAAGRLLNRAHEVGSERDVSDAYLELGWAHFKADNRPDAEEAWLQAAELAEGAQELDLLAAAFDNLGLLAEDRGDFATARARYERALNAAVAVGDDEDAAKIRQSLAGLGVKEQ